MEDHNCTVSRSLSLSSTQNEPHTPNETVPHINTDFNDLVDPVGVGSASDSVTMAKSEAVGSAQVMLKRGRGRPRKYDVNGSTTSPPPSAPPGFSDIESSPRRSRGRPRGSGKLQILASIGGFIAETAGGSFTPHVLIVNAGEDVVNKIMSFFHKGPRAVCILSANGVVSSVVIRQSGASSNGASMRYEGHFEILSLSGSCTYSGGAGGAHRKSGILTVSLAKPDGGVFGGGIESSLIAAGPIQLVMGTFKQNISNQLKKRQLPETSNTPNMLNNPDSERDSLKVPKLIEDEQSCPSPTSELGPTATTNYTIDNVIPTTTTTNGVADNAIPASVNGVGLEGQTFQPNTDQRTSADVDASAT